MMKIAIVLFAAAVMVAAHAGHNHDHDHDHSATEGKERRAIVRLLGPGIEGNITFTELADKKIRVTGTVIGLPAGEYGFHIHEKGDLTGGCATAGPHFNPHGKDHGHPNDENRHVGDLGNVIFNEQNVSSIDFVDALIAFDGPSNIIGRAVVLHQGPDDYGRTSHPDSKTTGNAGGRAACGVIGILDPVYGWKTNAASIITTSSVLSVLALLLLLY